MMRLGSLFTGLGGFDLAAAQVGMTVLWQCENNDNANRVLARHWPEVTRYGDITTLDPGQLAPVDLICGGFPCQDLSVAGRRAGLAGARSGLFWEWLRIVAALRPTWICLENVPGLLSSQRGRDLGTVLGAVGDLGYGWSYRVLDAQWAGVGQRRRRWFLVGCLGDATRAAAVLLEPEGVPGDPPSRRKAGAVAPSLLASGAGTDRPAGIGSEPDFLVAGTLEAHGQRYDSETETLIAHTLRASGADGSEDGTGRGTPLVARRDMTVRRLTPRECERLQGLPDDWTRWDAGGQTLSDSARYRLIGNAVAVPVVRWILSRMAHIEREEASA